MRAGSCHSLPLGSESQLLELQILQIFALHVLGFLVALTANISTILIRLREEEKL